MDYDQVARFLSSCTTPGFRRSLTLAPHDALARCGFHPGEAGQLAASLARQKAHGSGSLNEYTKVAQTFGHISWTAGKSNKSWSDDWNAP